MENAWYRFNPNEASERNPRIILDEQSWRNRRIIGFVFSLLEPRQWRVRGGVEYRLTTIECERIRHPSTQQRFEQTLHRRSMITWSSPSPPPHRARIRYDSALQSLLFYPKFRFSIWLSTLTLDVHSNLRLDFSWEVEVVFVMRCIFNAFMVFCFGWRWWFVRFIGVRANFPFWWTELLELFIYHPMRLHPGQLWLVWTIDCVDLSGFGPKRSSL